MVIGAVALAAYQYVRQTEDVDLAINADLSTLRALAESLREAGCAVELRTESHIPPACHGVA